MEVLVFNPAIKDHQGTLNDNLGDCIIWQAVEQQLRAMFGPQVEIKSVSSHVLPDEHVKEQIKTAAHRIVGGTNLLGSNMGKFRQWKVSGRAMGFRYPAVLMGVGWGGYEAKPDAYTKLLLKAVLSHKLLHSVRDSHTEKLLRVAGFKNVINTSCPTLWQWAGEPCQANLQEPSERVLLMLTDYRRDEALDRALVELLARQYKEIIFWPQGSEDPYYGSYLLFPIRAKVRMLERTMAALEKFLTREGPVDCIGTRLHGGIKCLKAGQRSLIIEVDNRAREIAKDTGLPTVVRNDLKAIEQWTRATQPCTVHVRKEPIDRWKQQFISSKD
ncbi:MAG TPA: polysaccharide pyruvyl transferase family protein [Verrucomicrobiae bacterium]|jgi:polysaccharide pyruvyl transferase WcaK-like protein